MPFDLDFDQDEGILRVTARGHFDLDEYRRVMVQITESADFPPSVPTLWDLRHFDFAAADARLARQVSDIHGLFKSRRSARVAFLVSDETGYGMMRMLQAFIDQEDGSHVCYDLDEAERWVRDTTLPRRRAGES